MKKRFFWLAMMFVFMLGMVFTEVYAARAEYTPELDTNIKVNTPAAGAILTAGSSYDITWDVGGIVQSVNIRYSADGGTSWYLQDTLDGNPETYTWTVPSNATMQGIIRIDVARTIFQGYPPHPVIKHYYNDSGTFSIKKLLGPILIKPAAPADLTVTDITTDTVDLSWTDKSFNESGFFIHRKLEGAPGYTSVGHVGSNITSFHDSGLTPGTEYHYVVTAYNSIGTSPFSNDAAATTLAIANSKPLAPTLLTALPGSDDTRIDLTWQNNSTNETGFYIYRKIEGDADFSKVHDSGSGGWSGFGDIGLLPGSKYYYYVSAYNALGSSDSNILSATTTGTPPAVKPQSPSDLTATAISDSKIKLIWEDNSNNESGFKLERSLTQVGGYTQIAELAAGSTAYDDNGLTAATTYFYRVKAYNSKGDSNYSSLASATTQQASVVQPPQENEPPNGQKTILRFYIDKLQYFINDVASPMDTAPVIKDARTLLPIRYVATPLGAEVGWDPDTRKVTISNNETRIELWIGKNTALINGVEIKIDPDNAQVAPVILPPGRTMLPLRFISENLGCQVDWNGDLREAKVTYAKQ
ncbi:MAG: stalk domain-containing protein [Syntrophomonadaceae bacterium]|nr:stalk domain-containing protein [Syntrophomonadaceae bacterium]